jgi:carboxylesterase
VPRGIKVALWVLGGLAILAALVLGLLFLPLGDPDLSSHPRPAKSYAEAVSRIEAKQAQEAREPLQSMTHSVALLHGSQTATCVVIFHGYTHSPYQWRVVSKSLYDAGYNVWVPLAPYHGEANRMTADLSKLTPELLRDYADSAVDIGRGLGRKVEVVGLSSGGDAVIWSAAERPDVARSVAIAPVMAPKGTPGWALMPVARWYRLAPDNFNWWQPAKEAMPGPAYPRFSFRGVFAFIQLSQWARARALRDGQPPVQGRLTLVANHGDKSVDTAYNVENARLLAPASRLTVFEIPASAGLGHDLVEPDNENTKVIGRVYGLLGQVLGVPLIDPATLRTPGATSTPDPLAQ